MFWWGIEQLFLEEIGNGIFLRGISLAVFSAGMFLFNIPTGAISDIWGRVRSLKVGVASMVLGLVVLSVSNDVWLYSIGVLLYSIFWTFNEGALEAFVYDSIADNKQESSYQKIIGRVYAMNLFGAGVANLFSGFVAEAFNLRFTYILSIVPAILCMYFLTRLVEPSHHKQVDKKILSQLGDAFRFIKRSRVIIALVLSSALIYTASTLVGEFSQVAVVEHVDTAISLGLIWAAFGLLLAGANLYAHKLRHLYLLMIAVIAGMVTYLVTRDLIISILPLVFSATILEALTIKIDNVLQHETESKLRATVTSIPGSISMLLVAVLSVLLGRVTGSIAIHLALVVVPLLVMALALLVPLHKRIDAAE